MNHRFALRSIFALALGLGLGLLLSAGAQAQAFRTYLSGGGNDANPCSLVAPCRVLPAAIAAVIDGGEVWMLDSANYNSGPVYQPEGRAITQPTYLRMRGARSCRSIPRPGARHCYGLTSRISAGMT